MMRIRLLATFLFALTLTAQDSTTTDDWRRWLNRGVEAYKSARLQDAVEYFQKSVDLKPTEVSPHLYLATALMSQYIPGAESPENLGFARNAEAQFNIVLQLAPQDLTALHSLASLSYQEAQGKQNEQEKFGKLDEAVSWYQRVLTVDPRDKEAYYSLGVIDWIKWYPNYMRARAQLGMRPEQPGPLNSAAVRQDLLSRYSSVIADGIANLEKALEIDPQYDDAMAYLNLFIRERADLRDTRDEYRRDVEVADQWVGKALAAKRSRTSATESRYATPPPPPSPPPPPARTPERIRVSRDVQQANATPTPPSDSAQRIRVGRDVQKAKLIRKVDPACP